MMRRAWLIVWIAAAVLVGQAMAEDDSSSVVRVSIEPAKTTVAPGGDLAVAVIFDHAPGYHIHTHHPDVPPDLGDPSIYIATDIAPVPDRTSAALTPHVGLIQWPASRTVKVAFTGKPVDYKVYAGRAIAYLPVTVAADAEPGDATLAVKLTYQACNDRQCLIPVRGEVVTTTVRIAPPGKASVDRGETSGGGDFAGFDPSVWAKAHAGQGVVAAVDFDLFGYRFSITPDNAASFAWLLIVAAAGGLLLNFTPCVLPVVPLKVMSLSQAAGEGRARMLVLGVAMCVGVVGFWLVIGGLIAFVSGFQAVNQLFQMPWFPILVGVVIAVMAVGMCGLFSLRLPRWVYAVTPSQQSLGGSAGLGVMTAVLSTPCTAPFMGAAAAWAALQSPRVTLATFAAIGIGMALPYFLLAACPRLIDRLPRAGPGSELIKQLMGLLMLAGAAYFIGGAISGLLVPPGIPPSEAYWWAVAACIAAAGVWLMVRAVAVTRRPVFRTAWFAVGALTLALAVAGGRQLTAPGPIDWVYYTPQRFAQAKADGKTVVMDFSAQWCLNCKTLEQSVLHRQRVVDALGAANVVAMKVDLTSTANRDGAAMLAAVDRLTIPLLVVFRPDGSQAFKSDFYTPHEVIQAVRKTEGGRWKKG